METNWTKVLQLLCLGIPLIFFTSRLSAQNEGERPYIFELNQTEGLFEGSLDNVPGDFYLYRSDYGDFGKHWDYVSGWFQYRGKSEQIPISGLISGPEAILFTGNSIHDSIEYWRPEYDNYRSYHDEANLWERLDSLKANYYDWKFRWGPAKDQRYWSKGEEQKRFVFFFEPSKLQRQEEYLVWGSRSIPLGELDLGAHSFEVIAFGDSTILMRYWYISNTFNPMGRCGAGTEAGLVVLHFDRMGLYKANRHFPIESCWVGYYHELELIGDSIQFNFPGEEGSGIEYINLKSFFQEPTAIYEQVFGEY